MASTSRSRVTFGDNRGDDDAPIANIVSDLQNNEGEPAFDEENQGNDGINEEENTTQAEVLKPVSKLGVEKSTIPLTSNIEDKSENCQDDKQDEAHNEEEGHDSDVESRSGSDGDARVKRRKSRRIEMSVRRGAVSSNVTKQVPSEGAEELAPRKRGRPPKKAAVVDLITNSEAYTRSKGNTQQEPNESAQDPIPRKRGRPAKKAAEGSSRFRAKRKRDIPVDGYRRSSRSASESATQKITEQSKRLKIANTQSEADHEKTPNPAPKTRTKKMEFEVDLIVARRKRSGITEYQVKWKGYNSNYNTWEPAANLTHCAQAISQFNTRRRA